MRLIKNADGFKRCLVLITTLCIGFVVMSKHNGSNEYGRLLQQEGGSSVVDQARKDILVVVMGQKSTYHSWVDILGRIDGSLTLLFGAYDSAPSTTINTGNNLVTQTAFIPDTTWTQARNLLAAEAIRMEIRRGKQFDYWMFLDDDVNVACAQNGGEQMEALLGAGSCWQKVFNFIGSNHIPEHASSIYLGGQPNFAAVSTSDAMFAVFKRSHVPYILPYASLPIGASEWSSQAALFCIMQTCMKSSTVLIPYISGENAAHREYTRGLNMPEIMRAISDNYNNEAAGFLPCAKGVDVGQHLDRIGPFATSEELNNNIPPTEFGMCSPMKTRFEEWESRIATHLEVIEGSRPLPTAPGVGEATVKDLETIADTSQEIVISQTKDTDILVIVMGESEAFQTWHDRLSTKAGSISLLFGSFDEMISTEACTHESNLDCQTTFIPDTSWTEGRNLLAAEALRKEAKRGKKYDYWVFIDDDVDADCSAGTAEMERLLGEGSCWQKIFNYIASAQVPENASIIALPRGPATPGFAGFSSTDAMFAAFKRDRVPYLLPYPTLKEGSSQWSSQASLFCIIETCMKSSAVLVPYVGGVNPILQRDFIRGYHIQQIRDTIADNYHDEQAGFFPCQGMRGRDVMQGVDPTGVFVTVEELNSHIPPPEFELCQPMKSRFERWESEQLVPEPVESQVANNEHIESEVTNSDLALNDLIPSKAAHFDLIQLKDIDTLVMVMGPLAALPAWKQRLEVIYGSVSLIYGSIDEAIPEDACHNEFNFDCQVAFIPSATWTDGRNLLAAEAIRKERMLGKQYDYWIFLDYEVNVSCGSGELVEHELLGSGSCWQEIFSFISSDNVPENASAISIPQANGRNGFEAVSTTDAMFAAYKRDRVPYLLPFATPREGTSQWNSQAALFCIMRTCMKSSTVHIPYVKTLPPFHFFVQEPSLDEIRDTIVTNYHDDEAGFHPCADFSRDDLIILGGDKTEAYATGDELNVHIPVPEYDLCEPLKKRFEAWEGQIR